MTNLSGTNLHNGATVGPQGEGKESPSTFPRYPAYKDSGVEWLGEVPEHWVIAPVGLYYEIRNGFPFAAEAFSPEGAPENRLIRIRDILGNDSPVFTDEPCPTQCIVDSGDILIGMDGDFNITNWMEGKAKLNQRVCAVRGKNLSWDRFFFYGISAPLKLINDLTFATTVKHLASSQVMKTRFPIPSENEVEKIARFLDHETARIDALIEEQQRLIELLKEKRQAVISHAVTKGLDPTVPMKDSGVEWLGEVPAHWSFKQSKYLFEFVTSGSRGWAEYYSDDGDLFFRIANLTRDSIEPKLASIQYVTPPENAEGERSKVRCGDILISITADLGSVCVANDEVAGSYVSQHVALARPVRKTVFSRWLAYFILSTTCKDQLVGAGYGGTKVQLSLEDIRSFWVSMPPYDEQISLAAFLDREVQAFDGLITQAAIGVDLLSERRSALISAAVTGKIDVRDWQPPTSIQAPELEKEAV